jgi:hypothetical protein
MRCLKEYHHFRKEFIDPNDRVTKCERYIVDLLLHSNLPDSERESSICWELKHQASTFQFAKILALKRGLPVDICALGLLLHDINSVMYGSYKDHAHSGTPIALQILRKMGSFSDEELDQISCIIYNHSDKHVWTNDPFQEIGKDADVLDTFLYEGAFDFYLGNKPLAVFKEYLKRVKKVWKELGLPLDPRFDLLDDYRPSWFQHIQTMPIRSMRNILAILLELSTFKKNEGVCPPPFCILVESGKGEFYGNQQKWASFVEEIATRINGLIPEEKAKIFSFLLGEFIKKTVDVEMIDESNSMVKTVISEESFREANSILLENQSAYNSQVYALLFWPLIDIYELLYGEKMIKRLEELGISKATPIKEGPHGQSV